MFDCDSLRNAIRRQLGEDLPDTHRSKIDAMTGQICDIVAEWVPKQGDFWLNEDDGVLYVNRGWEVVCVEAFEVTPEENERRFQEAMKFIKGITREQLVDLMGEDWLEEFRKVAQ